MESLSSLEVLRLNYNQIESLDRADFRGLTSLSKLFLYGNRIKSIDSDAFINTGGNITHINLGHNQLSSLSSTSFTKLTNLRVSKINTFLPKTAWIFMKIPPKKLSVSMKYPSSSSKILKPWFLHTLLVLLYHERFQSSKEWWWKTSQETIFKRNTHRSEEILAAIYQNWSIQEQLLCIS